MLTKTALKKLKAKQPQGYREEIAREVGCTIRYVDMVMRGERKNQQIIDLAIKKAEEHQEYLNKQKQIIKKL